jgi:hypothetical protein
MKIRKDLNKVLLSGFFVLTSLNANVNIDENQNKAKKIKNNLIEYAKTLNECAKDNSYEFSFNSCKNMFLVKNAFTAKETKDYFFNDEASANANMAKTTTYEYNDQTRSFISSNTNNLIYCLNKIDVKKKEDFKQCLGYFKELNKAI